MVKKAWRCQRRPPRRDNHWSKKGQILAAFSAISLIMEMLTSQTLRDVLLAKIFSFLTLAFKTHTVLYQPTFLVFFFFLDYTYIPKFCIYVANVKSCRSQVCKTNE